MSTQIADKRIGFIGCGAMARALAGGIIAAGASPDSLQAADLAEAQRRSFETDLGIATRDRNHEVVARSDVVVLCVKPGSVVAVLEDLARSADSGDLLRPLWVSIAAGVRIETLAGGLPATARIVRAMPNTPALVREGATAICANSHSTETDLALAEALFSSVGTCWRAPAEPLLDAVTGLSGSGPAYVFLVIEALGDAGVREGLPRDAAYRLAAQTVLGAARLVLEGGQHPAALKDQVTSPGGTTIAGLQQLEQAGVRAALYAAVEAATARSRELG